MSAASIVSALALLLIASPASPDSSKMLGPHSKIERKETACSHATSVPAHLTCSWIAHRGYIVCKHWSDKAGEREANPPDQLAILTSNDTGKGFDRPGICKDSKTLGNPAVVIEGNDWHYNYRKN